MFLEKGQVRFEGPAAELAERDDLARAVFLGTRGRLMPVLADARHVAARVRRLRRRASSIGLLAMGIVLVYRSTRVINFAVGNMGLVGAGLLVAAGRRSTTSRSGSRAVVALVVGTLYGAIMELVVIRRLFDAPRVIVLVATIGIAQLSLAILTAYPDITDRGATFPQAIGRTHEIGVACRDHRRAARRSSIVVPIVAVAARRGSSTARSFGKTRQGVGREPRPRPAQRHQPEAGLDCSCGPIAGFAGHAVDDR